MLSSRSTILSSSAARTREAGARWARKVSRNCAAIVMTGLSEFIEDWNTVESETQRLPRSSSSLSPSMRRPSKTTLPLSMAAGLLSKCRTALPSVDLPHPDSPTRPTNSPFSMANETERTAWCGAWSRGR